MEGKHNFKTLLVGFLILRPKFVLYMFDLQLCTLTVHCTTVHYRHALLMNGITSLVTRPF